MSADTGAVDAAEAVAVTVALEAFDETREWTKTRMSQSDSEFASMRAAIQAFQRANAERVTALVDELVRACMGFCDADVWHEGKAHNVLIAKRTALLLAVVGEVEK